MISRTTNFCFKGKRKYINFASLLESFRKTATEAHKILYEKLFIKNFKIHKYITQNSLMKTFEAYELKIENYKDNILAEMNCQIDGKPYFIGLYNECISPVEKRIEFPDKELLGEIHLNEPFSGTCDFIKFKNHHELFQAVSTANKQLHLLSLPEDPPPELKSAYLSEFTSPYEFSENTARLTVENMDIRENLSHKFTFNRLTLDIEGKESVFQLCYSIKKQ